MIRKLNLIKMKIQSFFPAFALLFISFHSLSQNAKVDSVAFFTDESVIKMTLSTDLKALIANKMKMLDQPATITIQFTDNSKYTGDVNVRARGISRKETCNMPPLMVNFKSSVSGLTPLEKLKLVCGCSTSAEEERLALKEFLAYKIYNQLTDLSFRVRLAIITYEDSKGKKKPFTQYGFFIEDVDVMAKRNGYKELNKIVFNQQAINRENMTLVEIFQYMIGNTDWSVPAYHNIKLIKKRKDDNVPPSAVPYDFDYCGLVNAYYAKPSELLSIERVTDREFRGFPKSMEVLQQAISVFMKQKENIYKLLADFDPLADKYKKEVTEYLNDFYKIISDPKLIQKELIDKARKN